MKEDIEDFLSDPFFCGPVYNISLSVLMYLPTLYAEAALEI